MAIEMKATREDQLVAWRRDQLAASGFPLPLARRVAGDVRNDVHALIELVERGCPAELAVRIVGALDGNAA